MKKYIQRLKEQYRRRAVAGLCPRCGCRPEPGFVQCLECREKDRGYKPVGRKSTPKQLKNQRDRYRRYVRQGRCGRCGRPAAPYKNCAVCRYPGPRKRQANRSPS